MKLRREGQSRLSLEEQALERRDSEKVKGNIAEIRDVVQSTGNRTNVASHVNLDWMMRLR